jgi:hypothetical protein
MLRGSSFVSSAVTIDNRNRRVVCTHMLCGLQPGRSAEDLIQMAGRVTGNGRSALLENMGVGAKVKILMNHQDFDLVLAYYRFQDELFEGLENQEHPGYAAAAFGKDWARDEVPIRQQLCARPRKANHR